jgi:hypothetical protein
MPPTFPHFAGRRRQRPGRVAPSYDRSSAECEAACRLADLVALGEPEFDGGPEVDAAAEPGDGCLLSRVAE